MTLASRAKELIASITPGSGMEKTQSSVLGIGPVAAAGGGQPDLTINDVREELRELRQEVRDVAEVVTKPQLGSVVKRKK